MFKRSVFTAAVFILVGMSGVHASWADETGLTLKEVTVTADRIETSVGETTSSVVVIQSEDIKKMNVQYVSDVLRQVPDLNLVQNGGPGQTSMILMRGGDSTQTLVMIDGIKVKSTTVGSYDFSGLTADDVERIEIVKGSQSTLYGSEAMSGIINIITKRGKGDARFDASMEGGSFNTSKTSASVSGWSEKADYRVTGSYSNTDGISAAKSGSERDGYRNGSVSGKIGLKPDDTLALEFTGKYYQDRAQLDDYDYTARQAVDNLNYVQYGDHSVVSGKGTLSLVEAWEQIVTVSSVQDAIKARDPLVSFNNYDIKTGMDTVDWQHNIYLFDVDALTAGVEYRKEKGSIEGSFNTSNINKAWYLNDRIKLANDKLIVNAGLRNDDHETAGNKTTYRAGALYDISSATLKIKGNYGTGFRAPTFNELYFPFYGNLDLKPEESKGWDLGFEKEVYKDKASFSMVYFDQDFKQLIDTDPVTFLAANIARAKVKGVETNVTVRPTTEMSIKVGHTYLDAKNNDTGEKLSRRAQNKVTVGADYAITNASVGVNYAYVGQSYDSIAERNLASYSLVNLAGTYTVSKRMTLFARVDNVFNTNYEEAGSYGTPGFSVFGGVRIAYL